MSDAWVFAPTKVMMRAYTQNRYVPGSVRGGVCAAQPRAAGDRGRTHSKELNLTLQADPKWQSRIERVEDSVPYRLLGGDFRILYLPTQEKSSRAGSSGTSTASKAT